MATVTSSTRKLNPTSNTYETNSGLTVGTNIVVGGTVDGRDIASDGSKLDGIESSATADQTAAEIRALVESASNSNVFTDADHTKLNGIATSANNYSLPLSSSSTRGGVKVGFTESGKNYPVELSSEKMFVNVPWTDTNTNTTYTAGSGLTLSGTTFSHSDTSTQASSSNSGRTYIQSINVDGQGHVTGLSTATETVVNTDTNTQLSNEQVQDIVGAMVTSNSESGITVTYQDTDGTIDFSVASQTDQNFTNADHTKLNGIATGADVTPSWVPSSDPSYATQSYVGTQITNLIDSSPAALNTLNELAAALGDDANFSTTVTNSIATKQDTLTAGSNITISGGTISATNTNTQLSNEQVQDIVGAMLSGNTESGITVTYDDTNNEIDFTVASQTDQNFTNADHTKLNGIETGATADQTAAEIRALVESATDSNVFTNADHTKLNGIEASADVTDTTNVVAALTAGSNVTIATDGTISATDTNTNTTYTAGNGLVLSGTTFSHSDTSTQASSSNSGRTYIQSINVDGQGHVTGISTATETVVNTDTNTQLSNEQVQDIVGAMLSGNTESGITVTYDDTNNEIDFTVASQTDQNFTNADHTKLNGIESGATADQTASEIRALVESATDSNVFTNADHTKLNGVAAGATNVTNNNQLTNGAGYITSFTETNTFLGDGGSLTTHPGTSRLIYTGALGSSVSGLFSASDNSNSIITLNRHVGNYDSQLGFSSNGSIYYRKFSGTAINTTLAWQEVWHSGSDGAGSGLDADKLDGQHASAFQAAGTYNTIIGTDSDINTSGSTIIDNIYVTDGVITSMGTRTLTLANLGYTGATNANYITNNNQLTNGAGYVTSNTQLSTEQVQDAVGAMLSGNTESGITVTYDDTNNEIDFTVASQTDNNFTTTLKNKLDGIASGATNVTNNNQLTNGAGYITSDTQLSTEQVQDAVGAMLSGNTESGITVTYDDTNNEIDFTVASQTDNNFTTTLKNKLDGIAAGATNVTNNNQLTNGAGYITSDTQLSTEQVQDAVGAMLSGNTESGITVTYDDTNNEIDFTVASQTDQNFTNADHTKLNGIATGAEVNVQSNWSATSGDALILNKPTIPSGNQIIDWTVSAGSGTEIHSDNYTNTTYSAGNGLTLSGTTFSHSDTSAQSSSANSGRTYIQSINLDGQGHVTGLSTATETVTNTDTNTTYSAGRGLDLSGTQFQLETDLRDSISYIGYDSNDYLQWSNNSYVRAVVSGSERFRVKTDGIDVTGIATADAFRTDTSNTGYNLITRNSTSGTLYVQAAQSNSLQTIASFRYGSATVNQGTETFRIRRDNVNVFGANFTVGGSITGNSKNFSIPHPIKEGKRLVHSCLEGPEIGVYFRGRSQSSTIEMPDYWDGLVHLDSMTVELTAIGPNQDLYVADIADDGDVTVASNTETPLNYFYVVYGERKDLERLEVEIDDTVEVEEPSENSEEP